MNKEHTYTTNIEWIGNKGSGTSDYLAYSRNHILHIDGKADLQCSSDSIFHGDKSKHNPEDFFVAALSACHMLWYLHLCADAGIIVVDYKDQADGTLLLDSVNGGRFVSVTLNPVVTVINESMIGLARELHNDAHKKCFIANSCNFPIKHNPSFLVS
jgi:organic hydroperoxide reductase OsmC/OhrA